ncbi:SUMF1/EgtB/PvdO family nonheme iron enzyme [Pseudanabaena sp. FACHB-1277]|jgi:formylglycine-generating enzyme required for sulfatase activity|uniref:SUMF1/EgtB/PvdO family nonheme iron enzyme n=1 Tax=Pseudanabaena cinerea FACHB-1277 TaxID=2949581 RepID=A0A926Z591_9CYAN|nr:SUMF1/EgtB/PvdO family nonheme iron enzyme [Pseudanabaena cinerea]MBD2150021.1 SUMF1/EgtB/PvdO family nonheme iron enzyme [Pseudanabaena cinerea FACHB-1277]
MTNDQPNDKSDQKPVMSTDTRRQLRHQRVQKVVKYLGLLTGGLGVFGSVGLWWLGHPSATMILTGFITAVGTVLAIAYKFISNVTNKVWDKIEEELEGLEEPLANWIVAWLKNGAIALYWNINPKFQRDYYQSLIDSFREFRLDGFRVGLPVLDLENVFVPLRVISASPEKISGAMIHTHSHSGSQEIWDFLSKSKKFQSYRRLAVVGAPGSGKTTLLKYLALIYAKKKNQEHNAPKFIPVLLYLRDISDRLVTSQPPNLCELIESHIKSLPSHTDLTPPPNWIQNQLEIGNCLVMLDGLDEVADAEQRQKVSQWVNSQMEIYRQTPFILTSRPDGYNSAPVDLVGTVLKVLPFTHAQMKDFIHSWYPQTEIMSRAGRDTPAVRAEAKKNADDLIDRIIDNRAIADMATNPLLVTMIATVHYNGSALPKGRVDLYQKICDVLLGARQAAKQNITTALTGVQNKAVLQVLALELMKAKTREFSLDQGEKLIADELVKVAGGSLTARAFLLQIKEICGLLMERELGVYEFAHLSFQEYLAASQIKESQDDTLLTANLDDPWWAETIRLYAAQGDATKLIEAAIAKPTVKSLSLAFDCLQEAAKVESGTRQRLTDLLEAGLESDDPQIAKLAAEVSLLRRLNNLCKVNENLEIDLKYITCAEFQLFLDEKYVPNPSNRFDPKDARNPVITNKLETVLEFCNWLNLKAPSLSGSGECLDLDSYYRLPVGAELLAHNVHTSSQVCFWTIAENKSTHNKIRIVRASLDADYIQLTKYLAAQEWIKADNETVRVILKLTNQDEINVETMQMLSNADINTINRLWLYYSHGLFSLGIQFNIWERLGGNPIASYLPSALWYSNNSVSPQALFATFARKWDQLEKLPFESSLSQSQFDVITVNEQGQETQRKQASSRYFHESLDQDMEYLAIHMVLIPAGSFVMGAPANEKESRDTERPQHEVKVPEFFMGKYPITQSQWRVVAAMPKIMIDLKLDPSGFKSDALSVENVSWYEAMEFCARLSNHTGRAYRLPSEAEWEYACRAGTTTPFHFGEAITPEIVNHNGYRRISPPPNPAFLMLKPVGSFPPNAFGLYDMHGNVWEWCADDWHDSYKGAPTDGSAWVDGNRKLYRDRTLNKSNNPSKTLQKMTDLILIFMGANEPLKLLRGGSWRSFACYSAYRINDLNNLDCYPHGFRVACSLL